MHAGEKNLFYVFNKDFCIAQKQFIVVNSQTQFIYDKRKPWRENQWKSGILEKVFPFCEGHFF